MKNLEIDVVDFDSGPTVLRLVECSEVEAESVLEIRVSVPNGMQQYPFRFPLSCRMTPEHIWSSRQINADGISPEGFGIGFHASKSIESSTQTTVVVSLSLSWTANDESRGNFQEKISATIGDEASRRELDGGGVLEWSFEGPEAVQGAEGRPIESLKSEKS